MDGSYYIANSGAAPVIEVIRGDMSKDFPGRVYWVKDIFAPKGLGYDIDGFSKWHDQISRWICKHGKKPPSDRYGPYHLPDAWSKRESVDQGHGH